MFAFKIRCFSGLVFLTVLLLGSFALGQNIIGTISGTVWDSTHAEIPNAKVTVTNTDLKTSSIVNTNGSGFYTVSGLRAGPYQITVEAPGFSKLVRSVQLDVNQQLGVDFNMQPGKVENVIEVTGGTPVINTQSADVNTVLQQRQIQDLPLNQGRYIDLALQTPATLQAAGQRSNPREGRFDIDGNLSLENNFVMNGVDNNSYSENDQEQSPQVVRPAADALQEVSVQTRTYTADFGFALGAVINTEVKSGSNDFHGDAWEFNRTGALAAEDYFAKAAGAPKPNLSWNQFGAAMGGHIIKNRTFWFADYQGTRSTQGQNPGVATVPTADMQNGIFPSTIKLKDPSTIDPNLAGCVNTATNTINLNALRVDGKPCGDPVGMKLVQLYPNPNSGQFGYTGIYNIPDNSSSFDGRVDHKINDTNNLFGVYDFYQDNHVDQRGPLPNILATGGFSDYFSARGQLASVTFLHTFTPNLLNDIRVGYNRVKSNSIALAPPGNAGPAYGLTGLPGTFANGLPPIYVGSYSFLGTSPWRPQYQVSQVYQLLDNLSYVHGNHTLKFGFEFKHVMDTFLDIQAPNGEIQLNNNYTGDAVGDLLLGLVSAYIDTTPIVPHDSLNGYTAYAQDTMRVTSKLTVNYGVRYEYFSPLLDGNGLNSNFDPTANGGRGTLLTNYKGAFTTPPCQAVFPCITQTNGSIVNTQKLNLAPRIGLAYSPTSRVVLRGGFGIFYQAMDREGSSALLQNNGPQEVTVTFDNVTALQAPAAYLRDGFPAVPSTFNPTTTSIQAQQLNQSTPYAEEYSFGPEIAISGNTSLNISYVGQEAHHLRKLYALNQGQIVTPGVGPVVFPFPDWNKGSAITMLETNGNSNYNALQVQATHRSSHGLVFNLGYTWSKSLGDVTDNLSTGTASSQLYPENVYNPRADYGPLNFDQRHRAYANWIYDLPFGQGKRWATEGAAAKIAGGWQWIGTYQFNTGVPISVSAPDQSGTFSANSRANCVAPAVPSGFDQTVASYMPKSSFAIPSHYTFGNCPVGSLHSWSHSSADMSLFKRIPVTEKKYFEFRATAFNIFNTPQFDVPNSSITSPNFGKTTAVADPTLPARITQLGLKFYW